MFHSPVGLPLFSFGAGVASNANLQAEAASSLDFIVADLMGVAVIPQEIAEETVRLAQEQADREVATREWVAQGKTVEDLLNEFGRI